jgi:phospholipid transport system transporter-binding protein
MFQPDSSITFANAKAVLQAGLQAIAAGQASIDFASVSAVDSSAVATMLAWRRAAAARSAPLAFENLPDNLRSLVALYDVAPLLDVPASARTDLPHH